MQRTAFARALAAGILAAVWACSSGSRVPSRSADVITAEDMAAVNLPTAFDVVERLRPHFLRPRGPTTVVSDTRLVVYQDNLNLGGVDMLRQIRAAELQEIRFLSASDATTRFGTGHPGGAIIVTTRKR
jgi:hypothetical protein